MPHVWIPTANEPSDGHTDAISWARRPLDDLTSIGDATIVRAATSNGPRWVVIAPPTIRVNGARLALGIAVLRDRDELWVDGERLFFSSEHVAAVVPFPGEISLRCPRCTKDIASGSAAVACPQCGVWHHQNAERACWTYSPVCTSCDQTTALDGVYRFDPEVLS